MEKEESKYCPTQAGRYTAYYPEYYDKDLDDWKPIPLKWHTTEGSGFPQPIEHGGINHAIHLCGYAQAQAIAWGYSAYHDSKPGLMKIKIRIQPYDVTYDIKAKKMTRLREVEDENNTPGKE